MILNNQQFRACSLNHKQLKAAKSCLTFCWTRTQSCWSLTGPRTIVRARRWTTYCKELIQKITTARSLMTQEAKIAEFLRSID